MSSAENHFTKLNAAVNLSTLTSKGSPNPSERDAGFCSGSSEVDEDTSTLTDHPSITHQLKTKHNRLTGRHQRLEQPNSLTDSSEDSVEVKVLPISYTRNKRKSTEPSRVICEKEDKGPLKKRILYFAEEGFPKDDTDLTGTIKDNKSISQHESLHLRGWHEFQHANNEAVLNPATILKRHPGVTTLHRNTKSPTFSNVFQEEPLALVRKQTPKVLSTTVLKTTHLTSNPKRRLAKNQLFSELEPNHKSQKQEVNVNKSSKHKKSSNALDCSPKTVQSRTGNPKRFKNTKKKNTLRNEVVENTNKKDNCSVNDFEIEGDDLSALDNETSCDRYLQLNDVEDQQQQQQHRSTQRNYKNMTRERRIEANARERTRVHTISAAYETLRKAVPSYSNSQKLSKLSVLRVACSYILTLGRIVGYDYSEEQNSPSIASCVDMVTKTIQTEGKIRKKKDE